MAETFTLVTDGACSGNGTEGLAAVPDGAEVELVTDSSYVANAIGKGWLDGWSRKGWRTSGKQPVANRDLWERMIAQLARLRVRPTLVRGHAGHDANERADRLAQEAAKDAEPAPPPAPPPDDAPPPRVEGQLGLDV